MQWRFATSEEYRVLAALNQQLIADEGHRNRMSLPELERRMLRWLEAEYRAVLFQTEGDVIGYALYRDREPGEVYIRQFLILAQFRALGFGRNAFELLRSKVIPDAHVIVVEVLATNARAHRFWQAAGFRDYAVTMELRRPTEGDHKGSGTAGDA